MERLGLGVSLVSFPGLEEWRQRLEALLKGPPPFPLLGLSGIRSLRERQPSDARPLHQRWLRWSRSRRGQKSTGRGRFQM